MVLNNKWFAPQDGGLSGRNLALVLSLAIGMSALVGCSSVGNVVADIGEPANTPPRPAVQPQYPTVFDRPAERDEKPLTPAERQKLEQELKAIRDKAIQAGQDAQKPATN